MRVRVGFGSSLTLQVRYNAGAWPSARNREAIEAFFEELNYQIVHERLITLDPLRVFVCILTINRATDTDKYLSLEEFLTQIALTRSGRSRNLSFGLNLARATVADVSENGTHHQYKRVNSPQTPHRGVNCDSGCTTRTPRLGI